MTNTASLDQLRPGDEYPGGWINSRQYTPAEVKDMEQQLIGHGLLQSLLVRTHADKPELFFVIAGNRRLAAMKVLQKAKKLETIPAFDPAAVPIIVRDDLKPGQDLAKSMIENVARMPLHPVDRFNTISGMQARGMTVEGIAEELQTTTKVVSQSLALAKLSPKLRDAWLKGKLKAEQAEAFTVTSDHAQQERVFKQMRDWTRANEIKRSLVGDAEVTGPLLAYVGKDEYLKAGGHLHEDLFSENGATATVNSPDLLLKLARQKADPKIKELKAEGWKWVKLATDFGNQSFEYWPKVPGGKNCKDPEKKKSGVIIDWKKSGELELTYGVCDPSDGYRPREESKTAKAKKKSKKASEPVTSAALMRDLSIWLTRASAATIIEKADMRLLLALLLSGANASGYSKAIDIEVKGLEGKLLTQSRTYRETVVSFPKMLAELLKDGAAAEKARLDALTRLVARSLDFGVFHGDHPPLKDADYSAVVEALSPYDILKNLSAQLQKNATDYFSRCGKVGSLAAIKEALGEDQARQISKGTGKAIAAFAAANVPQTGWLPPQLRPKAYRGPSKAKVVVMSAKKKPAAAPKKKAA